MFTLQDVEAMRRDYQIALCLYMLKAPLFTVEWAINCKNGEVRQYIDDTLKAFWKPNLDKVLRAMEYGYAGGELIYKLKHNKIYFDSYKEFHSRDIRVLSRSHEYIGFRVKNVENKNNIDLFPPKAFWFAMNREYGGWYGRSILLNVWESWFEKRSRDGAIDMRRLWFYKNSFTGGVIRHPHKDYIMPDGSVYSAREMAREQAERLKSGGVIVFPNTRDEKGEYQWIYEPPHVNSNATEIREYPQDLDTEITRGMGIPDSVLVDPPGTGSYSGRRVPERAFYVRLESIVHQIMYTIKSQMLDFLIPLNFEGEHDYEIITKPLIEIMSPEGTPPVGAELGLNQQLQGTTVGTLFGDGQSGMTPNETPMSGANPSISANMSLRKIKSNGQEQNRIIRNLKKLRNAKQ